MIVPSIVGVTFSFHFFYLWKDHPDVSKIKKFRHEERTKLKDNNKFDAEMSRLFKG